MDKKSLWNQISQRVSLSRRDLFLRSGAVAAVGGLSNTRVAGAAQASSGKGIYQSIGVNPVLNARGTFTIITGSQTLPVVKKAMEEASRSYVHMDELMEGVSKRLAEVTKAEWGIVTNGCCAAITHFTAACIAGSNPERMQRLPDLTGLKNEVIIPAYSRNVYDHAVRMLGTKIIEVETFAQLESAFNERTAMVYILAGPGDDGPLGTRAVSEVAKKHKVPVFVDAAAEILTIPNVHLERGADAVAYSGGKCIRGPQAAGLLLGNKALLQAAWLNSAPHHAFGRSLKVGKEEIMGMLAAVEEWPRRNHDDEWKQWENWLHQIADRVKSISGINSEIRNPNGLSNRTPSLVIRWDGSKLGITGQEVAKTLLDTEPRIVVAGGQGSRPDNMQSSVAITPYMMMPGDAKIVADRLHAVLASPPKFEDPTISGPPTPVHGQWTVHLVFDYGEITHHIFLEQAGANLTGTHTGEYVSGDLAGMVAGNDIRFRSSQKIEGTRLTWDFQGKLDGEKISGTVVMGEYGTARWTAQRKEYRTPGGVVRPVKSVL